MKRLVLILVAMIALIACSNQKEIDEFKNMTLLAASQVYKDNFEVKFEEYLTKEEQALFMKNGKLFAEENGEIVMLGQTIQEIIDYKKEEK